MDNTNFKYKLSINMIVKNEESNLEKCLDSLIDLQKHISTEIIIIDTGSNDNTKLIAKKYTDKVYDFKWIDDFSAARNFAISKSTGEWIFVIDADEVLYDENALINLIKNDKLKLYDSVKIMHLDISDSIKNTYAYTSIVRMFRNNQVIKYINKFHETPNAYTNLLNHRLPILKHFGYDQATNNLLEKKSQRNLKAMLEIYNSNKDKTNSRDLSKIADAYGIIGDWKNTLVFLKLTMNKSLKENNVNRYLQSKQAEIGSYFNLKLYNQCIQACNEYFAFKDKLHIEKLTADISVAYFLMCTYINMKDYPKIINQGLEYLKLTNNYKSKPEEFFTLTGKEGNQTTDYHLHICKLNLAHAYYILGDYALASKYMIDNEHDYFYENMVEKVNPFIQLTLSIYEKTKNNILLSKILNYLFYQPNNTIETLELYMYDEGKEIIYDDIIKYAFENRKDILDKHISKKDSLSSHYMDFLYLVYMDNNKYEFSTIHDYLQEHINNFLKIMNIYPRLLQYTFKYNISPTFIFNEVDQNQTSKIINYCIKNNSNFKFDFYNYSESEDNLDEIYILENIMYSILENNINSSFAELIYNINALAYFSELLIKLEYRIDSIENIKFNEISENLQANYILCAAINELRNNNYEESVNLLKHLDDDNFNYIANIIRATFKNKLDNQLIRHELILNIINGIFIGIAPISLEILEEYSNIYEKDDNLIFMNKIFNIRGE